jgi:hypothetical protein
VKTIFDACIPRDEVLSCDLRDEMFAARLKDVIDGHADPIYQDPGRFFENTYPTEGLRTLIREVLGRMSGKNPANSPFIRLETSFGGGKTHNLIALYHLAKGHAEGLPSGWIPVDWIPSSPWLTAGIVGSDMDPKNGIDHGDVTTYTLWGELAYQLRNIEGYNLVRNSDQDLVAPGTQVLDKLMGNAPALIMLDEMARYLRAAKAVTTSNKKSDLAEQTVAFLMTLIEFAASKEKVCVLLTLADSSDAFGSETEGLKLELSEARKVSARQERIITPTGETEISRIVTHRLFRSIDSSAAEETAQAYRVFYSLMVEQGSDIPQRALRAEYAAEMAQDYPFHPELLNALNRKTSTIPNFQKTRGALRLLALVVRRLWEERPSDADLIGVHHLDVGVDAIANDLTSRLERPAFRSVIEADIVSPKKGSVAHCQTIDQRWTEAGKPPYARRTAINVFLHSLTQGVAAGVDPADLMLSVIQPSDDPQLVRKALSLMLAEEKGGPGTACWFLHWDGHRYRFTTEPSLEKIIQDEIPMVGRVAAKTEVDERIRKIWKKGTFRSVYFPSEAAELDDDAREPKLVMLHYDAATSSPTAPSPPALVEKLFNHAGTLEGYRSYKNNVLFLVADEDQGDRMIEVSQRYLAIRRIVGDSDRMNEFNEEQRKKLKGMLEAAELNVRIAITRTYRILFYPSSDGTKSTGGISREILPAQDQGEIEKDQSLVLLRVLKQLDKVLTADDPTMPAAYAKAKAWPHGQVSMSTEDMRKEFARRINLKILLDVNQLKKTIKAGVSQGMWIYFDAQEQVGYGKPSPAPMIQFSEDVVLYLPEEANRLGIRIKGTEPPPSQECPLCHQDPCICGDVEDDENGDGPGGPSGPGGPEKPGKKKRLSMRVEGAPAQVFQAIADQFHDSRAKTLGCLVIRCEGTDKEAVSDAKKLGLAVPQLGKGSYHVEQTLGVEFSSGPDAEKFALTFAGSWDRYKRIKTLADAFGQEASKANIKTILRITYPDGLDIDSDQFGTMRDIFTSLEMGKLIVQAEEAVSAGH